MCLFLCLQGPQGGWSGSTPGNSRQRSQRGGAATAQATGYPGKRKRRAPVVRQRARGKIELRCTRQPTEQTQPRDAARQSVDLMIVARGATKWPHVSGDVLVVGAMPAQAGNHIAEQHDCRDQKRSHCQPDSGVMCKACRRHCQPGYKPDEGGNKQNHGVRPGLLTTFTTQTHCNNPSVETVSRCQINNKSRTILI
jgi:hypothetical protein